MQVDQRPPYVLVVDKDNKIQVRRIEVGEAAASTPSSARASRRTSVSSPKAFQRVRPGQVVLPAESQAGA